MTTRVTFHNMNNQSPYIFDKLLLGKLAFLNVCNQQSDFVQRDQGKT